MPLTWVQESTYTLSQRERVLRGCTGYLLRHARLRHAS